MSSSPTVRDVIASPQLSEASRRERLRLLRFTFTRTPTAQGTAEVELEWQHGERFVGTASGISGPVGDLRFAALATLRALDAFTDGAMHFDLAGVKTLRAFDATIAIVSVVWTRGTGPGEERTKLLGCHLADEDPLRSCVLATLQATNRVLGNYISRFESEEGNSISKPPV